MKLKKEMDHSLCNASQSNPISFYTNTKTPSDCNNKKNYLLSSPTRTLLTAPTHKNIPTPLRLLMLMIKNTPRGAALDPLHGLHASHFPLFSPSSSLISKDPTFLLPSSQHANPVPVSTQRLHHARQHSSHATAPCLGGKTLLHPSHARVASQVSGIHMRRRWRRTACSQGRLRWTTRSRRKPACQLSACDSSRRSVFLNAKRSIIKMRSGAESRI
jgi:hypothetical protein